MGPIQFWNWNYWSIPEMELLVNSRIGIDYLKKLELELINLELELKFPTKN